MKLLFCNLIKALHTLKENNIVHNDITPYNILIKSPKKIKICDFGESFVSTEKYEGSLFPLFWPSRWVSKLYLSPEMMTWYRFNDTINFIKYDPYKSSVFSLGLCLLSVCNINIKGLNLYGTSYNIHIMELQLKVMIS